MTALRIGTRGSALALWQARHVGALLATFHPGLAVNVQVIQTAGDRLQSEPPARFPVRGIFVKEIEDELLNGSIDVAVHSLKDLPGVLAPGLHLGAVLERGDPRDALVSPGGRSLHSLPAGAVLATGSPRRQAQILGRRSDLRLVPLRGNVDTRLRRLDEGVVQGLILAMAGLARLGLAGDQTHALDEDLCLPAPGQGALGIEIREADLTTAALVAPLEHQATRLEVEAERSVVAALEGGCQTPLAALARHSTSGLMLTARVASLDGRRLLQARAEDRRLRSGELGRQVAEDLLGQGAGELLAAAREAAGEQQ